MKTFFEKKTGGEDVFSRKRGAKTILSEQIRESKTVYTTKIENLRIHFSKNGIPKLFGDHFLGSDVAMAMAMFMAIGSPDPVPGAHVHAQDTSFTGQASFRQTSLT